MGNMNREGYVKETGKSDENYRIVQITDTHVGSVIGPRYIERMVSKVNALNADMVVITGDIFNHGGVYECYDVERVTKAFAGIKSKDGVFAVKGNHDPDLDDPGMANFVAGTGIRFIDNDVYEKPKIDAITKTILKIPGAINDSNKLRSLFDELSSKVCAINSAFNYCATQVYYLIIQSVGMTNAPQDLQRSQLTSVLDGLWAREVCLFEEALLNLINNGKFYFVYYDYEFSECYKKRNPRK